MNKPASKVFILKTVTKGKTASRRIHGTGISKEILMLAHHLAHYGEIVGIN